MLKSHNYRGVTGQFDALKNIVPMLYGNYTYEFDSSTAMGTLKTEDGWEVEFKYIDKIGSGSNPGWYKLYYTDEQGERVQVISYAMSSGTTTSYMSSNVVYDDAKDQFIMYVTPSSATGKESTPSSGTAATSNGITIFMNKDIIIIGYTVYDRHTHENLGLAIFRMQGFVYLTGPGSYGNTTLYAIPMISSNNYNFAALLPQMYETAEGELVPIEGLYVNAINYRSSLPQIIKQGNDVYGGVCPSSMADSEIGGMNGKYSDTHGLCYFMIKE